MAKLPAARVLVDILAKEGVKTIFGLPGGHTIGILDALYDRRDFALSACATSIPPR